MKKYRIIEERYPSLSFYDNESSELPKEIEYSKPWICIQERKSIFHKWRTIKECNTIKEAEFYIYNKKIEKIKSIIKEIKNL